MSRTSYVYPYMPCTQTNLLVFKTLGYNWAKVLNVDYCKSRFRSDQYREGVIEQADFCYLF